MNNKIFITYLYKNSFYKLIKYNVNKINDYYK